MSMNLFRFVRRVVYSFSLLLIGANILVSSSLHAFPFIPLSMAALGLPFFSSMASTTKGGVRKALANVDGVLIYVKIFLVIASIILLVFGIKLLKKRLKRRKLSEPIYLLNRIEADLVLLEGVTASKSTGLSKKHILDIESSKRSDFLRIEQEIQEKFFKKALGLHVHQRMLQALSLIASGSMNHESQAIFVSQWLKTFGILYR